MYGFGPSSDSPPGTRFTPPSFFNGRAISLIEVPVLSPASAHTCAGVFVSIFSAAGRGQAAFPPAFGMVPRSAGAKGRQPGRHGPPGANGLFRARFLREDPRGPTSRAATASIRVRLAVARTGAAMTLAMVLSRSLATWRLRRR
jgi:hypothetical protein